MNGFNSIKFTNVPGKSCPEEYILTMPNLYARGILFGKMFMELGDHVTISCPSTDLVCQLEFKVKASFIHPLNSL
jgi:hypothetical protein